MGKDQERSNAPAVPDGRWMVRNRSARHARRVLHRAVFSGTRLRAGGSAVCRTREAASVVRRANRCPPSTNSAEPSSTNVVGSGTKVMEVLRAYNGCWRPYLAMPGLRCPRDLRHVSNFDAALQRAFAPDCEQSPTVPPIPHSENSARPLRLRVWPT